MYIKKIDLNSSIQFILKPVSGTGKVKILNFIFFVDNIYIYMGIYKCFCYDLLLINLLINIYISSLL